jgi:membrane associated rhomboid family serine protease
MATGRKNSALAYIPGLTNNAVLQLIMFCGAAFVVLGMTWGITLIIYQGDSSFFNHNFLANIALPTLDGFKSHWWTVFTYGWFNFNGFWELLSSMLWLYCFGSVVQMLVGHRQVIPLFAYSLLAGGVFYLLAQLMPGELGKPPHTIGLLGPRAGLMGLATAAIVLTPKYRFFITETFSVPLLVVAGIFGALMILSSGFYLPVIIMLLAGAGVGFAYIKLLQSGYRPGEWIYTLTQKVEGLVTPKEIMRWNNNHKTGALNSKYEPKQGITQKRIDDILDKINQKGYRSLSSEERDILMKAARE